MTKTLSVRVGVIAIVFIIAVFLYGFVLADSISNDFESFTLGTANAQDGWTSTGAAGGGCAVYDHAVSPSFGVLGFGSQSLRISNAVTSGCFGDMTFSKSLVDEAGEVDATSGGMSGGTRQSHFEAEFSIRSMQLSQQPGLFMSVSPDRGDGSRMSYLGFSDETGGIDVIFYDTPGTTNPANFSPTTVATGLSRAVTHTAKFVIDFVDGPSNDVVKIYINGVLVHTGTTWENYFRFDSEASAEQSPRAADNLIFRTGGTAAPATLGLGYLIDNISLSSSTPLPTPPPPANACDTPLVAPLGYTLLNGTTGSDTVTIAPLTMFVGKGGNDIVNGLASGNYIICTGSGNDTITLGNGDFTINASNGNNIIMTGNGNGSIVTLQANDIITTGNGIHAISAGNGNNTIVTGDGNQTVTTGNAIHKITTGGGADVINAAGGINTVKSGAGNDIITTGNSIDNIDGGADTDTCNAGGGLNTVVNCEL